MPHRPRNNLSSDKSLKRLRHFADLVAANPKQTVRQLAILGGLAQTTARMYLDHMSDLRVASSEAAPGVFPRTLLWVMEEGYAEALDAEIASTIAQAKHERLDHVGAMFPIQGRGRPKGEIDHVPTRREVRKHWAPHHVRDPLVAFLFGPARVAA